MVPIYNIAIKIYQCLIIISSLQNQKAKQWLAGRKNIFEHIRQSIAGNSQTKLWVHVASVGEYEQVSVLLQQFRKTYPKVAVVLTFFSPSGYNAKSQSAEADYVFYLPVDTHKNAVEFLQLIKPSLILFVKYDFWYHYITQAKRQQIPLLLVSAAFRKNQLFFKWYGSFFRDILKQFDFIFTQNIDSELLIKQWVSEKVMFTGDTRFDRVIQIANNPKPLPAIAHFVNHKQAIVAGSTWLKDDEIVAQFLSSRGDVVAIIAPHEINNHRLQACLKLYPNAQLYSSYVADPKPTTQTIIIDNIGLLSSLYAHAKVCYVGGGFTHDGIHNILEAAVYGKPTIIGSNYKKYPEAVELVNLKAAFAIANETEFANTFNALTYDAEQYSTAANTAQHFVLHHQGSSEKIMAFVGKQSYFLYR